MTDIHTEKTEKIVTLLKEKKISPQELVNSHLDSIKKYDSGICVGILFRDSGAFRQRKSLKQASSGTLDGCTSKSPFFGQTQRGMGILAGADTKKTSRFLKTLKYIRYLQFL